MNWKKNHIVNMRLNLVLPHLLVFITVFSPTQSQIFYPFGSSAGDTINPVSDDGGSPRIPLLSPFLFAGRTYQQIYVYNNGFLTFNETNSFLAHGSQDIIAGLSTDLNNQVRGVISYHEYTSGSVLTRATQDINNYFPNLNFTASWVFVATWDKVAYYSMTSTDASFQVILISGSSCSFILMNYGYIGVTGRTVEAGYDTINSTNYLMIPGSNSVSSILNLNTSSNINVTGRWAFRVDSGPQPAPQIFYPYGLLAGDSINPAVDDGSSSVITLLSPFLFFGRTYQQIYVNNNGFLTFSQASSQYALNSFPAYGSQDIIAGLWTNFDNRVRGVISYHQYTSGSVLTRATQDINNYFPNLNFTASWVFVATWNKVALSALTNTETSFQVVLISGSGYVFVLMNYGDIAATGHPVEAGYDTINSINYFVIPGSNNGSSISNLNTSSNVNVPGRWAFRVDTGPHTITNLPFDPCNKYTVLDDPWRTTDNREPIVIGCDSTLSWFGWYRLFINGHSVQMPDTCVDMNSCGTIAPLWLSGGHPTVQDGVVTRDVCGSLDNICCNYQSNPIKVKACPGGYYVYKLVKPVSCSLGYCAGSGNIYTFGSEGGDSINPAVDDGSSSVIPLLSPFQFFGRTYQQIYVNNNGFLTFSQASSQYAPYLFPAYGSQDIIAGLWTDLDNSKRGVVSYHQYTNGSVLTRATQDINNYFPNLNFTASWVFVATWNKMSYYSLISTETSFQVVLISGSNYSFILMNYGDIAETGHPVEAGYDTIHSTNYFVIPGSNSGSSISSLKNSSNVNVPGRWAFRVDSGPSNIILKNTVAGIQVSFSSYLDLTQSGNVQFVLQRVNQELVKYGLQNNTVLKLKKLLRIYP